MPNKQCLKPKKYTDQSTDASIQFCRKKAIYTFTNNWVTTKPAKSNTSTNGWITFFTTKTDN